MCGGLLRSRRQARERGEEVLRRFGFRVEADLYERINIEALRRRISMAQFCTEAITEYLDSLEPVAKGRK